MVLDNFSFFKDSGNAGTSNIFHVNGKASEMTLTVDSTATSFKLWVYEKADLESDTFHKVACIRLADWYPVESITSSGLYKIMQVFEVDTN